MENITTSLSTLFEALSRLEGLSYPYDELVAQATQFEVASDISGKFVPVIGLIKKTGSALRFQFTDGTNIECSDKHQFANRLFAYDICIGSKVKTVTGFKTVSAITPLGDQELFDISVGTTDHLYASADGLIHHNTSMCAAMCMMLARTGMQVVVIVPSQDLINQTAAEFTARYKHIAGDITVGTYSGDEKNIDHPIVIATWQSLQNAPHYMGYFQAVIVDEAHGAKAEVIRDLINNHGKHIAYRYGVTGTFPKPETDQYALKTSIGQIHATVDAAWLIANGYLSSVDITAIETQDIVEEEFPDYQSEKAFLGRSPDRLELLAKLIMQKRDEIGNTLVLVNSIPQGQALEELIPGAVFLFGESATDLRKQNYKQYAERDDIILIATVGIASTGISIDRIFVQWLVDTGKSFVKCIQSVGRGLRKRGDKTHVCVFDFHSKLKFSKKHFKKRKDYYVEAGYPISKPVKLKYTGAIKQGLIS